MRSLIYFAYLSLAAILPLTATQAQAPKVNRYKDWSDAKISEEIKSLRKKFQAHDQDFNAPHEWKKMKAASEALAQADAKWIDERRYKHAEIQKWLKYFDAKQWQAQQEAIGDQITDLNREQYRRSWQKSHEQTLARHSALEMSSKSDFPTLRALDLDLLTFPRIDGSTSTQPLGVLIACKYFRLPSKWTWKYEPYVRFDPDRELSPFSSLDLDFGSKPEPEFQLSEYSLRAAASDRVQERLAACVNSLLVVNSSTHESYLNLIEGKSDLGLIARRPSASEKEAAMAKGVELEVTPVALDALVFIVNQKQTVANLTTKQIRDIYQEKITYWNSLGGENKKIRAYQRTEDSGSQELMRELVMKEALMTPARVDLLGRIMSSVYLNLTQDEQGLAYSVHYYEQFMIGGAHTKSIAVDGVRPTSEAISNRTYPYVSEVFVAIRKNEPEKSPARRLRDWLLTGEGQSLIQGSGYVPVAGLNHGN